MMRIGLLGMPTRPSVWTPGQVKHENNAGEERDGVPNRWMVAHRPPTTPMSERSCRGRRSIWLSANAPKKLGVVGNVIVPKLVHHPAYIVPRRKREAREWARTWLTAWRANPARDYGEEMAVLNKLLAREARSRELVAIKRRLELLERPHFADANALLAPIAVEIARLVTQEDPCARQGVRRRGLHAVVSGSNESAPAHVLQRHGLRQSRQGRGVSAQRLSGQRQRSGSESRRTAARTSA